MRREDRGYTLLELAIALTIGAIAVAMALPGFARMMETTHRTTASNLLVGSLMHARSEAVTRRHPVTVCPLDAQGSCAPATDWSEGWMIFLDARRLGQPQNESDILRVVQRRADAPHVRIGTTAGRRIVRFHPTGSAGGSNLTLSICSGRSGDLLGQVVVNRIGRARYGSQPGDHPKPCPY